MLLIGVVPFAFHVKDLALVAKRTAGVTHYPPIVPTLLEEMNAARVKRFVLSINPGDNNVAVGDGSGVWTAGDYVRSFYGVIS